MRTKQSWVWAIFLAVTIILIGLENNAEAQRRRSRVPANAQCTDSDNSPRDHNLAGRGEDRLTRGRTRYYSPQSRRYRTVTDSCNNQGQLVENYCDPVITYSYGIATTACGEEEICVNGACQLPPIVLNQCGTPEGGWQSGRTYVLRANIEMPGGHDGREGCFDFSSTVETSEMNNITLDCQGHTIHYIDHIGHPNREKLGVRFFDPSAKLRNISIRNCTITGFSTGLFLSMLLERAGPIEIIDNIFSNNDHGIAYSENQTGFSPPYHLIDNTACDNTRGDLSNFGPDRLILHGHGNHFNIVSRSLTREPRIYTPCEGN